MSFKPIYKLDLENIEKILSKYEIGEPLNFIKIILSHHDDITFLEKCIKTVEGIVKCEFMLFYWLSENPNAIHILEQHLDKVDWLILSLNPNAIHILEKNIDKVVWKSLSTNPNAINILERNLDKIEWNMLSSNINAIHILENNLDKVNWCNLSGNPNAVHILEKHLDKVHWSMLSRNPNAINILEQHLDKVDWVLLSLNPNATHILEQHLDKVDWTGLSSNENATHILEKHTNKINWNVISLNKSPNVVDLIKNNLDKMFISTFGQHTLAKNPNIAQILGVIDYEKMRSNCQPFAKELAEYVFHPLRLVRVCNTYELDLADYMELIGD